MILICLLIVPSGDNHNSKNKWVLPQCCNAILKKRQILIAIIVLYILACIFVILYSQILF